MSDKIMNALRPEFIERMRDWAMATILPDVSTVPSSWPSDGCMGDSSGYNRMRTPRMLGRVHNTQAAIAQLPARYQYAVAQYWWYEGRSLSEHARHRQIDDKTFAIWVMKGHEELKGTFAEQSEKWHRDHEQGQVDGDRLCWLRGLRPMSRQNA